MPRIAVAAIQGIFDFDFPIFDLHSSATGVALPNWNSVRIAGSVSSVESPKSKIAIRPWFVPGS